MVTAAIQSDTRAAAIEAEKPADHAAEKGGRSRTIATAFQSGVSARASKLQPTHSPDNTGRASGKRSGPNAGLLLEKEGFERNQ